MSEIQFDDSVYEGHPRLVIPDIVFDKNGFKCSKTFEGCLIRYIPGTSVIRSIVDKIINHSDTPTSPLNPTD